MTELPLFFVRDLRERGTVSALPRERDLEALWRGVRTPAAEWRKASERDRQHARARAAVLSRRDGVLVGESAAVLHGLPLIESLDPRVHVLARPQVGSRTRAGVRERSFAVPPKVVEVDGVPVASLADTVVDVARHSSLRRAVVVVDHVLHAESRSGGDPERLRERLRHLLAEAGPGRGVRTAGEAIAFADARAESPLESLSRVVIAAAGLPEPRLQHVWRLPDGTRAVTDFDWPEHGLVGEADGRAKYALSAAEHFDDLAAAVFREKRRENALRSLGPRIVRWEWRDALDGAPLVALLRAAGLSQRRGSRRIDGSVAG
ncbi:hypothetical protein C5C53_11010 [Rathayibacter sp. AY1E3]|uniref:hypothetical protein n=1 Tax=Rathayibacter sp. AY1E3 TaxID=2080551 RepID=UPI000CE8C6C9|nr:hypothetical protein [Rathayibacter sp. AY1E3]PPH36241.1 hypothetical protein C5C53_11010 [Rathayibacter sp. AY1E3]